MFVNGFGIDSMLHENSTVVDTPASRLSRLG